MTKKSWTTKKVRLPDRQTPDKVISMYRYTSQAKLKGLDYFKNFISIFHIPWLSTKISTILPVILLKILLVCYTLLSASSESLSSLIRLYGVLVSGLDEPLSSVMVDSGRDFLNLKLCIGLSLEIQVHMYI